MEFKAEEKYLSMMRAYAALERLATDTGSTAIMGHEPADTATRFFVECYHFKDYLRKDPRVLDAKGVELFINGSQPLSIAADVCNATKHAGLDKPARGPGVPDKVNVAYTLLMPAGTPKGTPLAKVGVDGGPKDGDSLTMAFQVGLSRTQASARVVLTIVGKEYDALAIATGCVAAWDHFILTRLGTAFRKKNA